MKIRHAILVGLVFMSACLGARLRSSELYVFDNVNLPVPDGDGSGLSVRTNIASHIESLREVRIVLNVRGEFNGDLYAYIRHITPGATNLCVLLNRTGVTTTNRAGYADHGFDVVFSSQATRDIHLYQSVTNPPEDTPITGEWQPDGREASPFAVNEFSSRNARFDSFLGAAGGGEWTLYLADLGVGGTNMLRGWAIELEGPAVPAVVWPDPTEIVYGIPLDDRQLNASSPVPGSFQFNPPEGTVLKAGSGQILTAVFTPSDLQRYQKTTNTVSLSVQRKPLLVSTDNKRIVFGEPMPALTVSYEGFIDGENSAVLDTPPVTSVGAVDSAGTYPINVGGASAANYDIAYRAGVLTVAKASTAGSVTAAPNPAKPGASVLLRFDLSAPAGATPPSGETRFLVDGVLAGSATLADGAASFNTDNLPYGKHTIQGAYAGDANYSGATNTMTGTLLIDTPPVAMADRIARQSTGDAKIDIAALLANDFDADADDLVIFNAASSVTTRGGRVTRQDNWLYYSPPDTGTNADSFTYTVVDKLGLSATGTVSIVVESSPTSPLAVQVINMGNNRYRLQFVGTPNETYTIEYTTALPASRWVGLAMVNADGSGLAVYIDTLPQNAPQRYYRIKTGASPIYPVQIVIARLGDGTYQLNGGGLPAQFYSIDCTDTLSPPVWRTVATLLMDAGGSFNYHDTRTDPVAQRYYRLRERTPNDTSISLKLEAAAGGQFQLVVVGLPSTAYAVEYSDTLNPPNWRALKTIGTDNHGQAVVVDAGVSPQRFYRAFK